MAKSNIGHIDPFDDTKEEFYLYAERMEQFFEANDVEDGKKVATFLSLIGPGAYKVLRNMLRPNLPSSETLLTLIQKLKDYYKPAPIIIAERFRFYRRNQQQNESVKEFVIELNNLAASCEFGTFLEEAVRDRIVCGIKCDATQKCLLAKKNLQLQVAIEIATAMELAEQNNVELKNTVTFANLVTKPKAQDKAMDYRWRGGTNIDDKINKKCYRCGGKHNQNICKYKEAKCYRCDKIGHIAPMCKSYRGKPKATANVLEATDDNSEEDEPYYLNTVCTKYSKTKVFDMPVQIHGKTLSMTLDTAADVSTIDEQWIKENIPFIKVENACIRLQDYNKSDVQILGKIHVPVQYGNQQASHDIYIVNQNKPCLFGKNMINSFKIDWDTVVGANRLLSLGKVSVCKLPDILVKYAHVFKSNNEPIKHFKADIKLLKNCQPVFKKSRNVAYALKPVVEDEIKKAQQLGIWNMVQHSRWAMPVVVVPKKTGSVRLCVDFRTTVNQNIDINQYPLPTQQDLFTALNGGRVFTKLDLSNAYQQVELNHRSQELLTLNTHLGLVRPNRLLYGIASAAAIFQSIMDRILQGLKQVICYQDDILVIGTSMSEHDTNLQATMSRLEQYNVSLNKEKCVFAQGSLEYLGHRIDENGIHPTEKKVAAIKNMPRPESVTQLRTFLGILNYYIKFVKDAATLLAPLHMLLKKETAWNWSQECETAFQNCKSVLTSKEVLVHYDPCKPLKLACDASPFGVGAIISHVMQDGNEQPIAYASRTLSPAEKNYPQIEREALSIIFGLKKFEQYLFGREFVIVTDHKPLITLFGNKMALPMLAAARLQRWSLLLSTYKYSIEYKKGSDHTNVDTLSRMPEESCNTITDNVFKLSFVEDIPLFSKDISVATRTDVILGPLCNYVRYGWKECTNEMHKPYFIRRHELSIDHGCLTWGMRVIIPKQFRQYMLELLHDTHPGITKMKSMARSHIWWPGIDADIEQLSKMCPSCVQQNKLPPATPLQSWVWPKGPWHRIHIDFAQKGESYFLIVVDAYSKWVEVEKMNSITSRNTIQSLRKMFSRYGLPLELVSDNGPQLISSEFEIFLEQNGVKHTLIPAYHPQSNGSAERTVQHFKSALAKMNLDSKDNTSIDHKIARFLLVQHATQHTTTDRAPSELFIGRALRTRLSFVHPNVSSNVETKQFQQKTYYDKKHSKQREIRVDDHVLIKQHNAKDNVWKKGLVSKKMGSNTWEVTMDGSTRLVHTDQIRRDFDINNDSETPNRDYDEQERDDNVAVNGVMNAPQDNCNIPVNGLVKAPEINSDNNATQMDEPNEVDQRYVQQDNTNTHTPNMYVQAPRRNPTRMKRKPNKLDL